MLDELETFLAQKVSKTNAKTEAKKLGKVLGEAVDRFNAISELSGTIGSYIYSFISTDSRDKTAAVIGVSVDSPASRGELTRSLGKPASPLA